MPAIQLTLLCVALVWGAVFLLRGSLLAGCLALFLSTVCLGRDFLPIDIGSGTLSIDRLVFVALLVAYVIHRSLGRTDPKPLRTVDYLLFGVLSWFAFSIVTNDSIKVSTSTVTPFWKLLVGFLMPSAVYWIARQTHFDERRISSVYWSFTILGVYLAVTGILEITGQWWLVFPPHIADPDVGIHFGRARGPFANSIRYGLYVCVCFFAAWCVWQRLSSRWKFFLLPMGAIFLAAIFFSYTRSVWLGLIFGGFLAISLTLRGNVRLLVLGSALGVGLLMSLVISDRMIHLERDNNGADSATSVSNRASYAYISYKMFKDRPLTGCGFGLFRDEKTNYLVDHSVNLNLERARDRESHNTVLTILAETGLVGLGLCAAVVFAWIYDALTMWRNPDNPEWIRQHAVLLMVALGIWFPQMLFHEVTFKVDINLLIFFLAGIMSSLRASVGEPTVFSLRALETESLSSELHPHFRPARIYECPTT